MPEKIKPEILPVNAAQTLLFETIFVNRRAYVQQSDQPGGKSGKYYYFRPIVKQTKEPIPLKRSTVLAHLAGWLTVAVYAINPVNQSCKWLAIDADYANALTDLKKLRETFSADGIEALPEQSRRGGHLWIFFEEPVPAAMCRLYVLNRANELGIPVEKRGDSNGIEVFPRQNIIVNGEFGNAIRAPLGIHRASMQRYWFEDAKPALDAQFALLAKAKRVSKAQLEQLTANMKPIEPPKPKFTLDPFHKQGRKTNVVPLGPHRRSGKNYVAACPACESHGEDRKGHHLSVLVSDPSVFHCWKNCSPEEIKRALGVDPRERLSFAA